jgi:hypothetical protein
MECDGTASISASEWVVASASELVTETDDNKPVSEIFELLSPCLSPSASRSVRAHKLTFNPRLDITRPSVLPHVVVPITVILGILASIVFDNKDFSPLLRPFHLTCALCPQASGLYCPDA